MRRVVVAAVIAVTGGLGVASASDPPASLRNFACQRALDPPARTMQVQAVMQHVDGTRHLAMRFEVLQKTASSSSWTQVPPSGDLGKWIGPSNPTLGQRPGDRWIVTKQVSNLYRPATYRFRVSFRWTGTHHHVIATQTLLSQTCYQPELRPDVLVKSIQVFALKHSTTQDRYVAVVRNRGATETGAFVVQFSDGSVTKDHNVPDLGARNKPHNQIQVSFIGPTCTPGAATVTADPYHQVDDYNRSNNTLTAPC